RTRVVDGDGAPEAKLVLAHVQGVANGREGEQRNGVQHEHRAQAHRHFLVLGPQHRPDGRDGRTAANGGAARNEVHHVFAQPQPLTYEVAQKQRTEDGHDREQNPFFARLHRRVGVHAEAQADNRELQQLVGEGFGVAGEGVTHRLGQHQPQGKRNGRRGPGREAKHQKQPEQHLPQRKRAPKQLARRVQRAEDASGGFRLVEG
nr:hypothetical protein [Tanacetum cinerariifolium]